MKKIILSFSLLCALTLILTACGEPLEVSLGGDPGSSQSGSSGSGSIVINGDGENGEGEGEGDASEASQVQVDNRPIEEKYAEAYASYTDVKAWIQIPGTYVDHAVVQSDNDSFYLEKGLGKSYNWYGSIFAHYANDLTSADALHQNTILFGHNKNDGLMFGSLVNYSDANYAQAHPFITLLIGDVKTTWEVFAALDCEVNADSFHYIKTSLSDDDIANARSRSYLDFDTEVSSADKILTLSTCTYKYTYSSGKYREDVRYVVMAKLVDDGAVAPSVSANSDRITPTF